MSHQTVFRRVAATLLFTVLATSAFARPDTRAMDCRDAQLLVQRSGALVLTTGPMTYDRYVASDRFCDSSARYIHPAWVTTRDDNRCLIGYTCQSWSLYSLDDMRR